MPEATQNRVFSQPRFQPIQVLAVVKDAKTGAVISEHRFDFNKLRKRTWFNEKLLVWAFRNPDRQVVVEIQAADWKPAQA